MNEMNAEYRARMYLGCEKLRALQSHDLAVVDARRLETLERIADTAKWYVAEGVLPSPDGPLSRLLEELDAVTGGAQASGHRQEGRERTSTNRTPTH